jgi:hypothetical protein
MVRNTMTHMIFGNNSQFEDAELEVLYAKFANEDRDLAESGLGDYVVNLERDDVVIAHA